MSVDMDSEDFLEIVWGKRRGWVDLPAKVNGNWIPYYTEWDGNGCGHSITRRIDSSLRDSEDLYFSVAQFEQHGRDERFFKPSRWLWADLDEVHPSTASKLGLTPTLAWESSAGRYQALWQLDRRVTAGDHDRLNQALSYALGADRGGWDLTQVLRLPGTRNFKYEDTPLIQLLWYHRDMVYDPRQVWAKVKGYATPSDLSLGGQQGVGPRKPMPQKVKAMLRVDPNRTVMPGERSGPLFQIERELIEAGWGEDDIYEVVKGTPWHKWAHRRDSEAKLREDIRRAFRKNRSEKKVVVGEVVGDDATSESTGGSAEGDSVSTDADSRPVGLPFISYDKLMGEEPTSPRWMVEGIWTDKAHGIIGGEAKTLKTTLALAMGISVASGKPFLGAFPVHSPGPVLMVQEEDSKEATVDAMRKIAYSYGLISKEEVTFLRSPKGSIGSTVANIRFPDDIPFRLLPHYGLDLTAKEHFELLEESVALIRPKMLILDPVYFMIGDTDTDRSYAIVPFLKNLTQLRFHYDVAIVLIHHMRKAQANRPGQRMLGSMAFHAWVSSALYCSAATEDDGGGWKRIVLEREFREQEVLPSLKIALKKGQPGDVRGFQATIGEWNPQDQLLDLVHDVSGITMKQASEELNVSIKTIARRAGHLPIRIEGGGKGNVRRMYIDDSSS